jgi:glutamate-1-semialdehyde 2,1-aminomutase
VLAGVLDTVIVVPFNNLPAMEQALSQHSGKVAAVITEPMMNGAGEIPAQPGYLKGFRDLCDRQGVLLILDEVVTFRLSEGGYQRIEGIQADLTALGKIIGGGFAVGAFGGRRDIMSMFDSGRPGSISHSGTFNANDVTMAAGIATLETYGPRDIEKINRLGERLRNGLNLAFRTTGIVGQSTGVGSLATLHWRGGEIVTAHDAAVGVSGSADLLQLTHLEMMNRGIFFPRRGQFSISTAMTERHVDTAIHEFAATLEMLKPYVAEVTPHLLAI